jgi:hypothetical protein
MRRGNSRQQTFLQGIRYTNNPVNKAAAAVAVANNDNDNHRLTMPPVADIVLITRSALSPVLKSAPTIAIR